MIDYEKQFKEARDTISEIDAQMAELFERRMNAAAVVAEYKKVNGIPVEDKEREKILKEILELPTRKQYEDKFTNELNSYLEYEYKFIPVINKKIIYITVNMINVNFFIDKFLLSKNIVLSTYFA